MLKILTLVGTRPEIIKLSCVIPELEKHTHHILAHTGQNYDYELNEIFFNQLGIKKPDFFLNASGVTAAETISNVIKKTDELIDEVKPDAFLIYGDTNSSLSTIAAKRKQIPIFHMEAGNRCFDLRVPEEINRKLVDHLSDINMVISEHARRYLLNEGLRGDMIFKVGSSMREVLNKHHDAIKKSNILEKEGLRPKEYLIISTHREENVDYEYNFNNFLETLNSLSNKYNKRIIVSTHPRTRMKLEEIEYENKNPQIQLMKPFGFFEYIHLQKNAFCVVSDSGTITEEASLLKVPGVMIRQAHERPEGMDEGTVIMSGLEPKRVLHSVDVATNQFEDGVPFQTVKDYDVENVSRKVLKIILSYTSFVNRTVWHKKA